MQTIEISYVKTLKKELDFYNYKQNLFSFVLQVYQCREFLTSILSVFIGTLELFCSSQETETHRGPNSDALDIKTANPR
jgi:hypothetical protein